MRQVLASAARGAALAVGVALVELTLVFVAYSRSFAGIWELQHGALYLLPTLVLFAGAAGAAGAGVARAAVAEPRALRIGAAGLSWLAGGLVGYSVSFGRHFEELWRRIGFVGLTGGLATLAVMAFAPKLYVAALRSPRWVAIGAGVFIGLLELANRYLFVRLYPGFHLTAAALGLGLSGLLSPRRLFAAPSAWMRQPRRWGLVLGGLVALGAGLGPAAQRLARFDNFRLVLDEQAPIARQASLLSARLVPAPALDETLASKPQEQSPSPPELRGRSVLLITVDALRADHLGAYGSRQALTPNMDALAREGLRFDHAYCATPHTSYSLTSLMTGKYIRPLLLQGLGAHSETLATTLRRYGYRTAAFYPPAVFFIDRERFAAFDQSQLGFEYQKREFLEGRARVEQLAGYLGTLPEGAPAFAWVHLFGPHEPYESHEGYEYGDSDQERYASEVAFADRTVGQLVSAFRGRYPDALVVVTADHGEEFGEHGGRYHGSSVYEEQVRVPLIFQAPGVVKAGSVSAPVQTIDLLPTVLRSLGIPVRPSVRGRDLSRALTTGELPGPGFAFVETDAQTLLAEGRHRLICERRLGACKLFDLEQDPTEQSAAEDENAVAVTERLRAESRALGASHGRYELDSNARAPGQEAWPAPILRGLAGDGDAAADLASLLDDAEAPIREKAAELLFSLGTEAQASALRLALQREEREAIRRWLAVDVTRLGDGAPLVEELLAGDALVWRRRAALALAERGDRRGRFELVGWWVDGGSDDFVLAGRLLGAFAKTRAKEAVGPLLRALDDLRLRPLIADTLAAIGDETARGALARAFASEPYHGTRERLGAALVKLGARGELIAPLRRWLGAPDPLSTGLELARQADVLEFVGGPKDSEQARLAHEAGVGALVTVTVPPAAGDAALRLLVLARPPTAVDGEVRVGLPRGLYRYDTAGKAVRSRRVPELDPQRFVRIRVPAGRAPQQFVATVPRDWGLAPGRASHLVVFAEPGSSVDALAVVPVTGPQVPESANDSKGKQSARNGAGESTKR